MIHENDYEKYEILAFFFLLLIQVLRKTNTPNRKLVYCGKITGYNTLKVEKEIHNISKYYSIINVEIMKENFNLKIIKKAILIISLFERYLFWAIKHFEINECKREN